MTEETPLIGELQHELKCRAQIIEDLQRDLERAKQMTNNANVSCHRLRDEIVMVAAQTHGIVKALMVRQMRRMGKSPLIIKGDELKAVRTKVLEPGDRDGMEPGDLHFKMRDMTDEEKEKETAHRKRVETAAQRVKENSPNKD